MTSEDKCAAAYCVMFIGLAAQTSILGPTMLGISQTYGEGPEAAASLFNSTNTTHVGGAVALSESLMGRGIGYFLGTVFIGSAFDRWPQKSHVVLFCCCMACSLSTALIPLHVWERWIVPRRFECWNWSVAVTVCIVVSRHCCRHGRLGRQCAVDKTFCF